MEAFCSTYSIDLFVIVYSVVDRKSLKTAERILLYLKENDMLLTRGAILVGNKTDLERQREVSLQGKHKFSLSFFCPFDDSISFIFVVVAFYCCHLSLVDHGMP